MKTLQYPFLHLSFLKCFDALPNSFVYSTDLANAFLIARRVNLNMHLGLQILISTLNFLSLISI